MEGINKAVEWSDYRFKTYDEFCESTGERTFPFHCGYGAHFTGSMAHLLGKRLPTEFEYLSKYEAQEEVDLKLVKDKNCKWFYTKEMFIYDPIKNMNANTLNIKYHDVDLTLVYETIESSAETEFAPGESENYVLVDVLVGDVNITALLSEEQIVELEGKIYDNN